MIMEVAGGFMDGRSDVVGRRASTYFCCTFDVLCMGGDKAGLVLVGSGHSGDGLLVG